MGYFNPSDLPNIFPDPSNQITAKAYLQKGVYPSLDQALSMLIQKIEENGEFEKYVDLLAEKQEKAQRDHKKREKERRRLEMGDDYESESNDDHHLSDSSSNSESSWSSGTDSDESQDRVITPPSFNEQDKSMKIISLRKRVSIDYGI